MKIFVTGASGYIGSMVVSELQRAGRYVIGLARSDQSADMLKSAGVEVERGTLDDLDVLKNAAAQADGVIHLAFKHDEMFSGNAAKAAAADLLAIQAMGEALVDSNKPLVVPSGTLALATLGRLGTEEDIPASANPRVVSEKATIEFASHGVRSSVIRISPTTHGNADKHGFIPSIIRMARAKGVSPYVGDGSNRWPAVYGKDLARLFRLAVEEATPGTRLHGVGEEGIPFRKIAEAIGAQLNVPTISIAKEAAGEHFSFLADFVQLDNPTSNALTQKWLGWKPEGPSLIADIEAGFYFKS